ncbi:MAG: hypothetical protein GY929_20015 [Actinomycetia bacterium]|nr:hypothetical protein [Actinomycetes bacterium]
MLQVLTMCWSCGADHWPTDGADIQNLGFDDPITIISVCPPCVDEFDMRGEDNGS